MTTDEQLIKNLQKEIDRLIDRIPADQLDEAKRNELRNMLKGQTSGMIRKGDNSQKKEEPKPKRTTASATLADFMDPSLIKACKVGNRRISLNEGVVKAIEEEITKIHNKKSATWTRPEAWMGGDKPVSTIEDRLKKLKERGIKIDISKGEALKILKDKGYHVLKEYAKPFVDCCWMDGKDYYRLDATFSLLHGLYYADYEIRGVLFDAIAHIETNLRTNLDFVCSQGSGHHLWYLDDNVVQYWEENLPERVPYFQMLPITQQTIAKLVRRRETERKSRFKTPHGLPYAYEVLRNMHLGELLNIYRALKNETSQTTIAQQYGLSVDAFIEMLFVVKDLRNAVAHNECLFLKSYGKIAPGEALFTALDKQNPALRGRTPMFRSGQVREGANEGAGTLADAMLAVQYFLSRISLGTGRVRTMRESLRTIFAHYTSDRQYPELKEVFINHYAYTIYMAKTEEDLDYLAQRRGYQRNELRSLMGFRPARMRKQSK